MTAMLIENATGIFTGLAGPAMRATGQIRIRDGVIVEIEPRHFGMHDPMVAPVTWAGSAKLRYLLIGGRVVVEDGAIPASISKKSLNTPPPASSHAWLPDHRGPSC
jgi:hypothetical protein